MTYTRGVCTYIDRSNIFVRTIIPIKYKKYAKSNKGCTLLTERQVRFTFHPLYKLGNEKETK